MEDQFKRLVGQVARALNLSAETVADYAESDEAIKGLTEAFKTNRTKIDTDGYQRAEGKIKADVERALKTAGIESPSFEKLPEGLDALKVAGAAKSGDALTEEQARENPIVKKLLADAHNDKLQAVTLAKKEAETELETKRSQFFKEQQDAKVEAQARAIIAELNPNLNPDAAKAQRQIARLVADIKNGHYKQEADGSLTPIDAEGKYLDNGAGGSKSFAEHVREVVTSEHDLPASQQRDHVPSGNPASSQTQLQHYKGPIPKTKEEYLEIANDSSIPLAARMELKAAVPDLSGE